MDIVIIDDSKEITGKISDFLKKDNDFNVVGVAYDGIEGLNILKSKKPDIAIIDIILPGKDGIGILEELNSFGLLQNQIKCIILTAVNNDNITLRAFELGASYVMMKPCDLYALSRRIKELHQREFIVSKADIIENNTFIYRYDIERLVTKILNEIGIMPNLKGYKYLRAAIVMAFEDETLLDGITKYLYPDVAKVNQTTHTRVERAIRHALESAWDKGNGYVYYEILGHHDTNNGKRPTNSEFIASMVNFLKINSKN